MNNFNIRFHVIPNPHISQDWPSVVGDPKRIERLNAILNSVNKNVFCEMSHPMLEKIHLLMQTVDTKLNNIFSIYRETFWNWRTMEPWSELGVLVFQRTSNHNDVYDDRGVGGYYNVGWNMERGYIPPHIILGVSEGYESRLEATIIHEFGHFLRQRAVWEVGNMPLLEKIFQEGLSENLVQEELGLDHVLHKSELTRSELYGLRQLINAPLDSEEQTEITEPGYRLGYRTVRHLLENDQHLVELFQLTRENAAKTIDEYCKSLISNHS